jgi:hypothetical protein
MERKQDEQEFCTWILKAGKRKGKYCNAIARRHLPDGYYCQKHLPKEAVKEVPLDPPYPFRAIDMPPQPQPPIEPAECDEPKPTMTDEPIKPSEDEQRSCAVVRTAARWSAWFISVQSRNKSNNNNLPGEEGDFRNFINSTLLNDFMWTLFFDKDVGCNKQKPNSVISLEREGRFKQLKHPARFSYVGLVIIQHTGNFTFRANYLRQLAVEKLGYQIYLDSPVSFDVDKMRNLYKKYL